MTNTVYHVTPISNYNAIMENGLIPAIGERSEKLESESKVYLFPNYSDCETALSQWLGEEFEDLEEELISLRINLPIDFPLENTCEWERASLIPIPSDYIKFYRNEG